MEFDVYPARRSGKLLPRHVMWAGQTRGWLFVIEEFDPELHRSVRIATIRDNAHQPIMPPLLDAVLLSAKPDWMTMTGWERGPDASGSSPIAFQQSWILVPTREMPLPTLPLKD